MKKIVSMFTALAMATTCLTSCGSKDSSSEKEVLTTSEMNQRASNIQKAFEAAITDLDAKGYFVTAEPYIIQNNGFVFGAENSLYDTRKNLQRKHTDELIEIAKGYYGEGFDELCWAVEIEGSGCTNAIASDSMESTVIGCWPYDLSDTLQITNRDDVPFQGVEMKFAQLIRN